MANSRAQREREADKARRTEEAQRRAYDKAVRKRRIIGIAVIVVVVAALFGAVAAATGEKSTKSAASSTTVATRAPTTSSTVAGNPNPPVSLPKTEPGAALSAATDCPAADGSAPRVTSFAGPPPMCIEADGVYDATIKTSKGDLQISLDAATAPNSVNNFIVLARYHYYDGLPITRVMPRGWAEVGDPLNSSGQRGPGYTIAGETPAQGSIPSPVIIAMIPDATGASGGGFLFGIADQAAGMPAKATQIGIIRDSRLDQSPGGSLDKTVQQEINKIGTSTGEPAEVVTITGVEVSPTPSRLASTPPTTAASS